MNSTRRSSARRPGGSTSRSPAPARGGWPVRERSLLRPVLGIPPVAAVGLALGTTALGVFVDLIRIGTVGRVFEIGYLLGCVLAVGWVRRRSIFLPAVQPPLLLAVVVPVMAVLIGAPTGGGTAESVLMAGAPLINAFPAMAVTTVVVLLVTAFRLLRQRLGPDDAVGRLWAGLGRDPGGRDPDGRAPAAGSPGAGSARADRRRSGSRSTGRSRSGAGNRSAENRGAEDRGGEDRGDEGRGGARAGERGRTRGGRTGGGEPEPRTRRGRTSSSGSARTGSTPRGAADGRGSTDSGGFRSSDPDGHRAPGGSRASSATRGGSSARTRRPSR
ncbi:DUF6542 domain-containing protein [Pseudonocardia parietis]|uniref:DUF6542 domain-containing protein n=1 Tax=Pseudonocardia parietis TaxID=570936 RepID=A0ABS4W3T2_9PSEU|nr:DUF6542 domain-containing protein [Pseudonocardia parietis]MBP2370873.1 hypothetical protein [Pseudonocardia parietis]